MRFASEIRLVLQNSYSNITFNRATRAFFLLSVLFCFAQGIIQSFLFSVDTRWRAFTSGVISLADIDDKLFLQYTGHMQWEICRDTPVTGVSHPCTPFYTAGQSNPQIPPGYKRDNSTPASGVCLGGIAFTDLTLRGAPHSNGSATISLMQLEPPGQTCELDSFCTRTLLYPNEKLRQAIREDLTLVALQFWLLGVAIFAIVSQSVPHLIALIFARVLSVGWSSYTVWRTHDLRDRIAVLIGDAGTPCHLNIFPPYFSQRAQFQIVDLVLHTCAFLWTLVLSWNLIRVYLRTTFKRVGPPRHIVVIYRYYLAVLVGLQLSVFFLVVAISLWIDQLMRSALTHISEHTTLYQAAFIATVLLLLPWIATGWFAVRNEKRLLMIAFLGTSALFIALWAVMFYSQVYRFSFIDWPFFGSLTCTSFVVMLVSAGFGIVCWRNFGEGLSQYLYVEQALRSSAFEPEFFTHDAEKGRTSSPDRRITLELDLKSPMPGEALPPYTSSHDSLVEESKSDLRAI